MVEQCKHPSRIVEDGDAERNEDSGGLTHDVSFREGGIYFNSQVKVYHERSQGRNGRQESGGRN